MNSRADHEAYLRAALHAAADSLQPRGDGLERIRVRLQHRPRAIAWILAAADTLRLHAPAVLQDASYRLSAGFWSAWDRFAPDPAPGKHRSRAQGWLRPLAAMAAVIFIVAAGTYVAIDVSTAVSPTGQSSNPRNGQPRPAGPAASPTQSQSQSTSGYVPAPRRASPSPTCDPNASPAPPASPSCQPSTSPQPQPSASPSASPSPSPTSPAPTSPAPTSPAPTDSTSTGD
jgi:hypothetical protein